MTLELGSSCPPFSLPGTDGITYTLANFDGAELLVIVASCNHCPYVVANEPRIVDLSRSYRERGVRLLAVNGNDASRYPDDAMSKMAERSRDRHFDFPYVRDEPQSFLRALGARFTPEVFVFDAQRKLRYKGRIDDNPHDLSRVRSHDLKNALDALLLKERPIVAVTAAVGCSIKWL